MFSKRRTRALFTAVLVIGLGSACGGTPTQSEENSNTESSSQSVYAELNSLAKNEQVAEAVKRAKNEGQLHLYTTVPTDFNTLIVDAFENEYEIDVTVYRASSEDLVRRVSAEAKANKTTGDVLVMAFLGMMGIEEKGLLAKFDGPARDKVADWAHLSNWTGGRANVFLPVWNTNLVKPGEEPRSWVDLADPRYKGKLIIEPGDYDWYAGLTRYWLSEGKTHKQVDRLWRGIVANARVVQGHSLMASLVASGEAAIAVNEFRYIADGKIDQGAPLAYASKDGITHTIGILQPNGVGVLKNASHPAAAWLFEQWMTGGGGQEVWAKAGFLTSTKVPGYETSTGLNTVSIDPTEVFKNLEQYSDDYDALLRGIPQIQGK